MDDKQLIKYCINGKAKYQRMLLDKYSPMLMGVASRYTYDDAGAKDILQESWIKIFKSLMNNRYDEQGKLQSWMSKIVINTALKSLSQTKARILNLDKIKANTEMHYDSQVIENMTIKGILKIIDKLPSPSNQVFKLFIVDGLKHKEISALLGIAESTSRVHLTNARVKMKGYFPNFQELINSK